VRGRNALPPSPSIDGDGVRVFRTRPARPRWMVPAALGVLAAALALGWALSPPARREAPAPHADAGAPGQTPAAPRETAASPSVPTVRQPKAPAMTTPPPAAADPADWPSGDPRDLASHFRPGDPEPTAGEVIRALQEAGDFTGLGAFNPPGTSPPLRGLAVPPDFVLPPGYVRHHQVTDDGVPLEPILMFAPDLVMLDAAGQPIALPDDRVVPPELAPPGLPIRTIEVPSP
jgi:hypothetical protein